MRSRSPCSNAPRSWWNGVVWRWGPLPERRRIEPTSLESVLARDAVTPEVPGGRVRSAKKKFLSRAEVGLECSPEPPQQPHRLFPQEQWTYAFLATRWFLRRLHFRSRACPAAGAHCAAGDRGCSHSKAHRRTNRGFPAAREGDKDQGREEGSDRDAAGDAERRQTDPRRTDPEHRR